MKAINKMKPTNPNAHTYVEDDGDKVSIMIGHENVNAHTYRRTVEQHHCSESVFSPRQQHWRRNAVARGKQRLPRHGFRANTALQRSRRPMKRRAQYLLLPLFLHRRCLSLLPQRCHGCVARVRLWELLECGGRGRSVKRQHGRQTSQHSTLYTPYSTLYTLHSTLRTSHSTLHTLHFPPHTADW